MQLWQFPYSPFAAKVRKCLELKGLPFEIVDVPYLDRRGLIEVTGGSIEIPVLVDGGAVLADSGRITAHLDQRYPPSLRPGALAGPAVVFEQWADEVLDDVAFRLASPAIAERMAGWNGGRADAAALFRVVKERKYGPGCLAAWRRSEGELGERLTGLLAPLLSTLAERPFLLGDEPTLADAAVWGQLYMVEVASPGHVARLVPGLMDWYRQLERRSR